MKIDKVLYHKVYFLAMYGINERIGFEAQLEEGEDPIQAINNLREMADAAHKPLENDYGKRDVPLPKDYVSLSNVIVEEVPKTKEQQQSNILKLINSCKEKKVLESFKLIAQNNPELLSAYNKKMEELV